MLEQHTGSCYQVLLLTLSDFSRSSKMASSRIEHKIIHADKLAVFTCNDRIDERQVRLYVINNWKKLTLEMDNSTILFIAGVHGLESGKLGPREFIEDMKNQVSFLLEPYFVLPRFSLLAPFYTHLTQSI